MPAGASRRPTGREERKVGSYLHAEVGGEVHANADIGLKGAEVGEMILEDATAGTPRSARCRLANDPRALNVIGKAANRLDGEVLVKK